VFSGKGRKLSRRFFSSSISINIIVSLLTYPNNQPMTASFFGVLLSIALGCKWLELHRVARGLIDVRLRQATNLARLTMLMP
jgi:hypothetical protein